MAYAITDTSIYSYFPYRFFAFTYSCSTSSISSYVSARRENRWLFFPERSEHRFASKDAADQIAHVRSKQNNMLSMMTRNSLRSARPRSTHCCARRIAREAHVRRCDTRHTGDHHRSIDMFLLDLVGGWPVELSHLLDLS